MDRGRITWVDYAKGIGIFLVVLGHTLRGLGPSGIIADGPAFRSVDTWIYSFHMPLFFLLSGLFAERGVRRDAATFFRDRLATIAYPYLVWSVLQTLVQASTGRYANRKVSVSDLGGILVEPIMQFWFLYALFVIGLIYYGLRRCGLGPSGALAAFAAFWATERWLPLGSWTPLLAARKVGVYYALGSVLDRSGWTERVERAATASMALTAALGYAIVAAAIDRPRAATPWTDLIDLAVALCGIAASIALAVLLSRARGWDFVRVMGVASLEIFVAHTIASAGIRIGLQKVLQIQDAAAHIVLGTAGGVVLPLILSRLCRRHHAEFLFRFPRRRTLS